jgi:hypothetical protein
VTPDVNEMNVTAMTLATREARDMVLIPSVDRLAPTAP